MQCTPDMLPGDITGSSILDQKQGTFEFRPGPVFTNVLLSDEINRATPKTQSALLEAMAERRVSVDGVTYDLPRPFLVLATQNPVEQAGHVPAARGPARPVPVQAVDGLHEPRHASSRSCSTTPSSSPSRSWARSSTPAVVRAMIDYATDVEVAPEVGYYIVDLVHASRKDPAVAMGGSPRAAIALLRASRCLAASDGREHVYPDDVRAVLPAVMAHRIDAQPRRHARGATPSTPCSNA